MAKHESPWSVREKPDGKFAVQELVEPRRTVLDGLTQQQAERLQVYLTDLMGQQAKVDKSNFTGRPINGRRE